MQQRVRVPHPAHQDLVAGRSSDKGTQKDGALSSRGGAWTYPQSAGDTVLVQPFYSLNVSGSMLHRQAGTRSRAAILGALPPFRPFRSPPFRQAGMTAQLWISCRIV